MLPTPVDSNRAKAQFEHGVLRITFPKAEVREVLERYAAAREVMWLQEEPQNMCAWTFVAPQLQPLLGERTLRYVGRPLRASPAEGWSEAHVAEQHRIISEILQAREVAAHAR